MSKHESGFSGVSEQLGKTRNILLTPVNTHMTGLAFLEYTLLDHDIFFLGFLVS
jgi:hypothetical protein